MHLHRRCHGVGRIRRLPRAREERNRGTSYIPEHGSSPNWPLQSKQVFQRVAASMSGGYTAEPEARSVKPIPCDTFLRVQVPQFSLNIEAMELHVPSRCCPTRGHDTNRLLLVQCIWTRTKLPVEWAIRIQVCRLCNADAHRGLQMRVLATRTDLPAPSLLSTKQATFTREVKKLGR